MKHHEIYAQRAKLLKRARDLARSGQHDSHITIAMQLHGEIDFPDAHRCLTDRTISSQLDRLCAMAQSTAQTSPRPLVAVLADIRAAHRS